MCWFDLFVVLRSECLYGAHVIINVGVFTFVFMFFVLPKFCVVCSHDRKASISVNILVFMVCY